LASGEVCIPLECGFSWWSFVGLRDVFADPRHLLFSAPLAGDELLSRGLQRCDAGRQVMEGGERL
jgi:hypothetical protein